jgi:hypothetical protein
MSLNHAARSNETGKASILEPLRLEQMIHWKLHASNLSRRIIRWQDPAVEHTISHDNAASGSGVMQVSVLSQMHPTQTKWCSVPTRNHNCKWPCQAVHGTARERLTCCKTV